MRFVEKSPDWLSALLASAIAIFVGFILNPFPYFFPPPRHRATAGMACVSNLRTLDGAKATWALENHKTNNEAPTWPELIGPTLYIKDTPQCPKGGIYTLNALNKKPTCSIQGHTF